MYNDHFDVDTQSGIRFLELNLKWYPDSPNAYINLGDGYKNVNDAQKPWGYSKKDAHFSLITKNSKLLLITYIQTEK